jgi:CBS domain containing-hemolysin-like protein
VPMVPETKPLDELLGELQHTSTSIAVVLDEYGRMVGIVTVEDIIEEAVGEIRDETDGDERILKAEGPNSWKVAGEASLADLSDLGIELPVDRDSFNSIGGYVFSELGRLPEVGDVVHINGYRIEVCSMEEHRIESVLLSLIESAKPSKPRPVEID